MLDKKTAVVVLILVLGLLSLAATIGTIDYVFGVKNKPEFDVRSYVWTRTYGHGASGNLSSAGANTATLIPCPAGISATSVAVAAFHIYNGTGAAETPVITSFSAAGANCTIGFTTVYGHTGSWVLGPNGGGIQEALIDANGTGKAVHVVAGTYLVYAPIYVSGGVMIYGDGPGSNVEGQTATTSLFDVGGSEVSFKYLDLSSLYEQTTGQYGIRLGSAGEVSGTTIDHVGFTALYDGILSVNASHQFISNINCFDIAHVCVVAQDTAHPDWAGPKIVNMVFQNVNLGANAEAAVLINSTSNIQISNSDLETFPNQLKWAVEYNSTTSGGWVSINGVKCEDTSSGCFSFTGYGAQINLTGNMLSNSNSNASWTGISVNGSSGSGFLFGTIVANTIQVVAATGYGVHFQGTISSWGIFGNTIDHGAYGLCLEVSLTGTTIGPNNITSAATIPIFADNLGTWLDTASLTYAQITNNGFQYAVNGSHLFCSDCKNVKDNAVVAGSACVSGGVGAEAYRSNGAWVCN
jgi:hypothetical protein